PGTSPWPGMARIWTACWRTAVRHAASPVAARPAGWLLPDPGDQLSPGLLHPVRDDGAGQRPDPGGRHGGGIRYEAASEAVTQVRREHGEELRNGVGVAADDEP